MPDLSCEGVQKYWENYPDQYAFDVIRIMEEFESWTYDGDGDLEKSLKNLGEALDGAIKRDVGNEHAFVNVAAHVKTGRGLRLLMAVDSICPGGAAKIISYAEKKCSKDPVCELFIKRNLAFERMRFLGRIFSNSRRELITRILEEPNDV